LYSTFAKDTFHSKSPFGYKASWTDDSLYRWKVLFLYYLSCYDSGRKTEALLVYEQLKQLIISNCEYFNKKDLLYIQVNSPVMLGARNRIIKFRKKINHLITLNFLMPTLVDVG
jgi:hypothetical protein